MATGLETAIGHLTECVSVLDPRLMLQLLRPQRRRRMSLSTGLPWEMTVAARPR